MGVSSSHRSALLLGLGITVCGFAPAVLLLSGVLVSSTLNFILSGACLLLFLSILGWMRYQAEAISSGTKPSDWVDAFLRDLDQFESLDPEAEAALRAGQAPRRSRP